MSDICRAHSGLALGILDHVAVSKEVPLKSSSHTNSHLDESPEETHEISPPKNKADHELLLTLDVMTQPNEVKTLMGYINTLERYAKKYETKPVKKKSGKRKEHIDEIPVTDENTGSEETDYMPDNPSNLFDLLEDSDETYPPEADVLPTDIDDFLRAGYARYLKQKENKEKNNPAHPQLEDSQP